MDAWDIICLFGIGLITAGIGVIYWPACLIFAGTSLVAIYVVREYGHNVPNASDSDGESG